MERAQKGHSRPHGTLAQRVVPQFSGNCQMHHLNQYAEAEGAEFQNVYSKDVDSLLAKAEKARILSPSSLVIIPKDYSAR
jgi:hypothetical protein